MTNRLKIGKKVNQPLNSFKFAFEWFHGDADAYSSSEVIISKDNEHLSKFIEYLDKFDEIEGSDVPFKRDKELANIMKMFEAGKWENEKMGFSFTFEKDSTSDGCCYASQDGLTVTYFDETGIEHEVNFK